MASIFTARQLKSLQYAIAQLEQAKSDVEQIAADAREKYDNRTDKWRDESEAGQQAGSELELIDDAASELDTVINNLTSIEGTQS